ncbi:alpha- and gamma-adaptin-binding protein p34 isoform X3 [Hydra vulgaris]|uniref:Alpha- and gamma-adaptin-binding protein p34 isoform X3 n=1 Tax=Hydra vulgaris TaxID=6087 RepID=A0ABM4DAX8_HYDVU
MSILNFFLILDLKSSIMKNNEIQCVIVALDNQLCSAFNVIKSLLADQDLVCLTDISYHVWNFTNKYFSSKVNICCCTVEHILSLANNEFNSVEGVIFVLNGSQLNQIEKLKELFSWLRIEPEINLVFENAKTSEDDLEQSNFVNWCTENQLELVLSQDIIADHTYVNDFKEKFGIDRIVEALSSHVWKNHVTKQSEDQKLRTQDTSEDIPDGDSFEEIFSKFSEMKEAAKVLKGNERKDLAEKVAMAFMEAFDLEESDEN